MLYVCENNLWAANTPAADTLALGDVAARAAGYGISGVVVDGNDVLAVYEAALEAVKSAQELGLVPGGGSALLLSRNIKIKTKL